jgi:hypothetical protein
MPLRGGGPGFRRRLTIASRIPQLAAGDESQPRQPFRFGLQGRLSTGREFVVDPARVLHIAFHDEARIHHALKRAIQSSGPHFDPTITTQIGTISRRVAPIRE